MAKRKKRRNGPKKGSGFFKPLLILAAAGLLAWMWQENKTPEPKRLPAKKASPAPAPAEKKAEEAPVPESQPTPEVAAAPKLTGVFPAQAWLDDYLQVPAALEGSANGEILV